MSHLKLIYDFLNVLLPIDLMSLFRLSRDVHTTPRVLNSTVNNLIYIPSFNTVTYGKDSLKYRCAKLWNDTFKTGSLQIDADKGKNVTLSKIRNSNGFKKSLKKHFLYSYTVESDFFYY